ncbi:MAG: hypothetical protein F4X02_07370 [Chloroflexi bacterium]|nr:hypothetical protein [Chloroflexota bacterium]
MDKTKTAPRRLLGSRRFWSSVISVVTLVVVAARPELEEHLDVLAPTITTICVTLVGGYVLEDRELAKKAGLNESEGNHDADPA